MEIYEGKSIQEFLEKGGDIHALEGALVERDGIYRLLTLDSLSMSLMATGNSGNRIRIDHRNSTRYIIRFLDG